MSNTYAINVTVRKEFAVEEELQNLGLKPWVPRMLKKKWVKNKGKNGAWAFYDAPYIEKTMFCVIPAIMHPDVRKIRHVMGKPIALSRMDIKGTSRRVGLETFKERVQSEYDDMKRHENNAKYVCQYEPGQALTILSGSFQGFSAGFQSVITSIAEGGVFLDVEIDLMGAKRTMRVDPDMVGAA
jgi:hypothetical protein